MLPAVAAQLPRPVVSDLQFERLKAKSRQAIGRQNGGAVRHVHGANERPACCYVRDTELLIDRHIQHRTIVPAHAFRIFFRTARLAVLRSGVRSDSFTSSTSSGTFRTLIAICSIPVGFNLPPRKFHQASRRWRRELFSLLPDVCPGRAML